MSAASYFRGINGILEGLAQRLRDHHDPAVRVFAEKVIASIDSMELADGEELF